MSAKIVEFWWPIKNQNISCKSMTCSHRCRGEPHGVVYLQQNASFAVHSRQDGTATLPPALFDKPHERRHPNRGISCFLRTGFLGSSFTGTAKPSKSCSTS